MKIIAIERTAGNWSKEFDRTIDSNEIVSPALLPTSLIADSAIVRVNTPLFVPDFAADWSLIIAPAYIIGRLGKSIAPRFAQRYIAGCRLVARLLPSSDVDGATVSGLAATFDGAIALGAELDVSSMAGRLEIKTVHESVHPDKACLDVEADMFEIEKTIALVSRYTMLRTGDLIVPCSLPLQVKPMVDTRLKVTINGSEAMNLKIK